jgi:hypothetical protein
MFGCSSKDVNAKVVNNALVVSFMASDPPRVWRADMSGLSTATLEVREGQPGKFRLVMKRGDGAEEDISTFTDKASATGALKAVTDAMMSADEGTPAAGGTRRGGGFRKAALWIGGIFVVLWLMSHFSGPAAQRALPPGVKTGTPVPAEQLFGGK